MWCLCPSPHTRVTPGLHYFSSLSVFKILKLYSFVIEPSPSTPNFEETLIVAIKQGVAAKAAISSGIKTIDSIINYSLFLLLSGLLKEK
jgi:hypothetical protein